MGRLKAIDSDGREVWIKDDYLDNYVEQELYRIFSLDNEDSTEAQYWLSPIVKKRTEELEARILVLEGELASLRKTKEERLEEELWINNKIKELT